MLVKINTIKQKVRNSMHNLNSVHMRKMPFKKSESIESYIKTFICLSFIFQPFI